MIYYTHVNYREKLGILKNAFMRVLPHWTDIFVENRDTLRVRSSVWFTTRMLATGKNSEVLKSACARVLPYWTDIVQRIATHSVLGVVCDVLRARVSAEKKLRGSQKCVCEGLTPPNWYFVENRDTLRIRSSVWFTTRTSNYRDKLGGSQKCVCEGFTSLNWYFCRESWYTPC